MLSLPQTALVAFVTALLLSAQTPQLHKPAADATASQADSQTSTLSVQARLVVVPVVVRDKKGAVLGNLTKENFALTVDAKPQPLRYFDHDTDLPLTVGLLIDTSRSQTAALDGERKASGVFLDKLLAPAVGTRPADRAFILQFAHSAELLQDVTDSHSKLERGLKEVDGNTGGSNPPGDTQDNRNDRNDRGRGGRDASGGTVLYDAVFLAADEIQSKQPNRRALIVLTDGDDRGSKENLARSIEAAQRADTVVYAIYFKGEDHPFADRDDNGGRHGGYGGGFPGGGGYPGGSGGPSGYPGGGGGGGHRGGAQRVDGKKVLERMCSETGGRVFEVSKKNTLDVIYAQIGEELRQGYRLAFTPPAAEDEGYHRIDVTLTGQPAKDKPNIQTRDGYYTAEK